MKSKARKLQIRKHTNVFQCFNRKLAYIEAYELYCYAILISDNIDKFIKIDSKSWFEGGRIILHECKLSELYSLYGGPLLEHSTS